MSKDTNIAAQQALGDAVNTGNSRCSTAWWPLRAAWTTTRPTRRRS